MQLHLVVKVDAFASICYGRLMTSKDDAPGLDSITAWARLVRTSRSLLSSIEHSLKQNGLPPLIWYDVLHEIAAAGEAGLRPFEIQQRMLLEQYGVSRLLARMQKQGLIARSSCADDGRGHSVVITASGLKMRRDIWAVYGPAIEDNVGKRLSKPERAALIELLGKLADAD